MDTKAHIFEPLLMANTQFPEDFETIVPNAAISYQATENGFKNRTIAQRHGD